MTKEDIIKPENLVAKKPTLMNDNPMHYCPGCSHGAVSYTHLDVYKRQGEHGGTKSPVQSEGTSTNRIPCVTPRCV